MDSPASTRVPPAGATGALGLIPVGPPVYDVGARTLTVGGGKQFGTIAAAIAASRDGDVLLVDAGTYTNDFATIYTKLTILAVGGRVTMAATAPPPNWKGILTVEADLRIEGFTFTGCRIPDAYGNNGAGIRQEGGQLTLVNDEFRGNQNGILSGASSGTPVTSITIDHCLFDGNGGPDGGGGNIHNIYIGRTDFATVTNSVFENALVGHEYKSRALVNTLTNNLFISGVGTGTGSYDIDIPNGGRTTITSNTIVKGPHAENSNMVHFGGEGIPYAGSALTVTGNLFTNSNPAAVGVLNHTSVSAVLEGNVLDGLSPGAFFRGPARAAGNYDAAGTRLDDTTLVGALPGHTAIFTDVADHSVVLAGGAIQAVQGGVGRVTVDMQAGHVIVIGGQGGLDLTEGVSTGGNQYTTAAGSTNTLRMGGVGQNTIDSRGTDLLIAGDGNQSAQIGGTATIIGGRGNSSWSVNGTASIRMGPGSTAMTLGAEGRLTLSGATPFFSLATNGGSAVFDTVNAGRVVAGRVSAGAVQMQVYDGRMHITTAAGGLGAVLRLDQGDATVMSLGPDVIYAGSGDDTVILSGKSTVYAGTGKLSVFGRGNAYGADVYGAGGDTLISGDGGNITYHGGAQDSTVRADLSSIRLLGGAGRLTIEGGAHEVITGGLGGIVLHERGGGGNVITTQAGSANLLDLTGADRVESRGQDAITTAGGNQEMTIYGDSRLSLGDGNSVIALYGHDSVRAARGFNRFFAKPGSDVSFDLRDMNRVSAEDARTVVVFSDPLKAAAPAQTVSASGGVVTITTRPGDRVLVETDPGHGASEISAADAVEILSSGADRLHLGTGAAKVMLRGNGAEVWAGSGSLALAAYGPDGGQFTLHGGAGALSATLGWSSLRFIGGRGSAELSLNDQAAHITFGSGYTVVHAGQGGTRTYDFLAGQRGTEVIEGFRIGVDTARLGAGLAVVSDATADGARHMVLNDGTDVRFVGLTGRAAVFQPGAEPLLQLSAEPGGGGLFDDAYYLAHNPDVAAAGVDPYRHFLANGWREGRDPSTRFSLMDYLAANPDVKAAAVDPLLHYLKYGRAEGRAAFAVAGPADPAVDAAFYYAANPDVRAAGASATAHYYAYGSHEGRNPNAFFDTNFYLAHNPDVAAAQINPLLHYERFGWHEGRNPSAGFSTKGYLAAYSDVKSANVDPLLHFVVYGQAEGRAAFAV